MAGTASLGVRSPVSGPSHRARVIAAFPAAIYLELSAPGPEPRVGRDSLRGGTVWGPVAGGRAVLPLSA